MKRIYTDEDRERARVVWEMSGGNINATARETSIPIGTIFGWVTTWKLPPPVAAPEAIQIAFEHIRMDKKAEIISVAWDLARAAFDHSKEHLPGTSAKDAAVIAGIAIDKAQLLSGEPTERVDIRAIINSLPESARSAVIALLAEPAPGE